MKKGEWTFLTNHGTVFCYVAKHPEVTVQKIAQDADLSIRAVQNIITALQNTGYVEKHRQGRCNRYSVHTELPMRHRLHREYSIGGMLMAVNYNPNGNKQSARRLLTEQKGATG